MEDKNEYWSVKQYTLKKKIINALNESGLPICFEECILRDIYYQVKLASDKQLEAELENISKSNQQGGNTYD